MPGTGAPVKPSAMCDFCSVTAPAWLYPAGDVVSVLSVGGVPDTVHDVSGPWMACEECHMLVQKGDREALAKRGVERILEVWEREMEKRWRHMPRDVRRRLKRRDDFEVLVRNIRDLHEGFFNARRGAPVAVRMDEGAHRRSGV